MAAFLIFGFINFFVLDNYFVSVLDLIVFIIFLVAFFTLRKTKDIDKAASYGVGILALFMFAFAIVDHNQSFGLIWTIFVPIFAISMFGHKKGFFISLVFYVILFSILFYGLFYWESDNWDITSFLRFVVASIVLVFLIFLTEYSLNRVQTNLHILSITDALTFLCNRRKIDEMIQIEYNNFKRYKTELSLCMLDIDNFKLVNDVFGHAVGDEVLIQMAEIFTNNTRTTDIIGRWGGEEFVIIMPHTSSQQALKTIEKLREKINEHKFDKVGFVTCSFGIYTASEHTKNLETMFIEADKKLYEAKNSGKDCIVV